MVLGSSGPGSSTREIALYLDTNLENEPMERHLFAGNREKRDEIWDERETLCFVWRHLIGASGLLPIA